MSVPQIAASPYDVTGTQIATHIRKLDRAQLILIEPCPQQSLGVFAHRSKRLNFTTPFHAAMEEFMYNRKNGVGTRKKNTHDLIECADREGVLAIDNRVDARFDMRAMDHQWKFVLMIKDCKSNNSIIQQYNPVFTKNDVILEGYCVGEPVGPLGNINENCVLQVTNKRVIQHNSVMNPYGVEQTGSRMAYNQYVVDFEPFKDGTNQFYRLDMEACQRSVHSDEGGSITGRSANFITGPTSVNFVSHDRPTTLDTRSYSARNVLQNFTEHLIRSHDEVYSWKDTRDYATAYGANPPPISRGSLREDFINTMNTKAHGSVHPGMMIGPNEHEALTMRDIGRDYHVTPTIIRLEKRGIETWNESGHQMRDVFSHWIAESLMALMGMNDLSCMEFMFESRYQYGEDQGMHESEILFAAPVINATVAQTHALCQGVLAHLEKSVFRSIYFAAGDFDLCVKADLHGMIYILLNFKDFYDKILAPYQYPAFFTGMITSNIGDSQAAHNNLANYTGLLNTVASSIDQSEEDAEEIDPFYESSYPSYRSPM